MMHSSKGSSTFSAVEENPSSKIKTDQYEVLSTFLRMPALKSDAIFQLLNWCTVLKPVAGYLTKRKPLHKLCLKTEITNIFQFSL